MSSLSRFINPGCISGLTAMRESQQGGSKSAAVKKSKTPEEQGRNGGRISVDKFEDPFTKRLGTPNGDRHRAPPTGRSKSTNRARRNTLDPSILAGRGQHVPQVSEVGCGCKSWNGIGLGIDLSPSSTPDACKPSGSKTPSSAPGALNRKLSKSVTGIFFRRSKPAQPSPSPKFEEEWSSFREQHQQEMKEMKQMYSALQSMCQEIKTITLQPSQLALPSVPCEGGDEFVHTPRKAPSKVPEFTSEKRGPREKDNTPRRAKSAPKTRTLGCMGPPRDMSNPVSLAFNKTAWNDSTTSLFEEIVQVQKAFLRSFCASLVKHGEARVSMDDFDGKSKDVVGALIGRLMPHTSFAKPWHLKYGVEAWVNRIVLGEFGSESYGLLEKSDASLSNRMSAWDEYQKLALLSPTDAIDPDGKVYHRNFHMFCNRKFQAIHDELQWWDEWPQSLVEDFLEAMKHVWRAHKLAFSFEPPAAIFCVKTSTTFDPKFMESLDVLTVSQFDSSLFSSKVGFMVTPGFLVQDRVIKSQVYLMPKVGLICSPVK